MEGDSVQEIMKIIIGQKVTVLKESLVPGGIINAIGPILMVAISIVQIKITKESFGTIGSTHAIASSSQR